MNKILEENNLTQNNIVCSFILSNKEDIIKLLEKLKQSDKDLSGFYRHLSKRNIKEQEIFKLEIVVHLFYSRITFHRINRNFINGEIVFGFSGNEIMEVFPIIEIFERTKNLEYIRPWYETELEDVFAAECVLDKEIELNYNDISFKVPRLVYIWE